MLINSAYGLEIESLDVVVIEDSESMIRILRAILSAFGISNIRSYNNCEAALADMLDKPPDLVITDWRMEPMSGLRFLRNLRHRTMGSLAGTAVVMISGYASAARVKQAMLSGANQFLVKPVSPAALLARLEGVVQDDRKFVLKGDHYVIDGMEAFFAVREKRSLVSRCRSPGPSKAKMEKAPRRPVAQAPRVDAPGDDGGGAVWEL